MSWAQQPSDDLFPNSLSFIFSCLAYFLLSPTQEEEEMCGSVILFPFRHPLRWLICSTRKGMKKLSSSSVKYVYGYYTIDKTSSFFTGACALLSFLSRTTHFRPCNVRSFTHFRLLPCSSCDKFNSRVLPLEETEKKKEYELISSSSIRLGFQHGNEKPSNVFFLIALLPLQQKTLFSPLVGPNWWFPLTRISFLFFENNFKISNKFVLILFDTSGQKDLRRSENIFSFSFRFWFFFLFAARVCGLLLIIKLSPSRQTDGGNMYTYID